MEVTVVPCLRDNYAYLLWASGCREAIVVDPGESEPVELALEASGLTLVAIFQTHHHWDHIGGNEGLLSARPGLRVFGHEVDRQRIPGLTDRLSGGARIRLAGLSFEVLHVSGHTQGALTYVGHGTAFTGDTLFAAGCGRLLEGTAEQLHASLERTLARLPGPTRVFCGHEYTLKNLAFATSVEAGNSAVRMRREEVALQRSRNLTTMPTTIALELETNPFLRTNSPEIRERLGLQSSSSLEVFSSLRTARNSF